MKCVLSSGEYSNALSTLSSMVVEVEGIGGRPFEGLLQECQESQLLLLLILRVSDNE